LLNIEKLKKVTITSIFLMHFLFQVLKHIIALLDLHSSPQFGISQVVPALQKHACSNSEHKKGNPEEVISHFTNQWSLYLQSFFPVWPLYKYKLYSVINKHFYLVQIKPRAGRRVSSATRSTDRTPK